MYQLPLCKLHVGYLLDYCERQSYISWYKVNTDLGTRLFALIGLVYYMANGALVSHKLGSVRQISDG